MCLFKRKPEYKLAVRHLASKGDKTAIIWEPNDPKAEAVHISYNELHQRVEVAAQMLKNNGIKKGDRVCLYMPMVPELAIAVLACPVSVCHHVSTIGQFSLPIFS